MFSSIWIPRGGGGGGGGGGTRVVGSQGLSQDFKNVSLKQQC